MGSKYLLNDLQKAPVSSMAAESQKEALTALGRALSPAGLTVMQAASEERGSLALPGPQTRLPSPQAFHPLLDLLQHRYQQLWAGAEGHPESH